MPAFLIHGEIDPEGNFEIPPEDLSHLTKVLRVREGQSFEVLLPGGGKGWAILKRRGSRYFGRLRVLLSVQAASELPLWVGIGLIRWPRLEWLVEKATELGLRRLSPLKLKRGRLPKAETFSSHKIQRLHKIAHETQKQCERMSAPQIDDPTSLETFLQRLSEEMTGETQRLLFRERITEPPLSQTFSSLTQNYVFLIGPEGGWSPEERRATATAGFQEVSLGATPLRSETAALYGMGALHFYLAQQGRLR